MSDTCNGARATKRLLAAMAELAGQKQIGAEAWAAMNEVRGSQPPPACPPLLGFRGLLRAFRVAALHHTAK
jgi:hypothetical protein